MRDTVLELVAEQSEEGRVPRSLAEGIGRLHLHLLRLGQEAAKDEEEQDAERLLQELVGLASVAVAAGTAHVLPAIEREGE